jgi:hypothetical protein
MKPVTCQKPISAVPAAAPRQRRPELFGACQLERMLPDESA